jgi:predicted phosphoribosyltransferase
MEAEEEIKKLVDEWVCLMTPREFMAIGNFYEDFSQVSDQEVVELLKGSQTPHSGSETPHSRP